MSEKVKMSIVDIGFCGGCEVALADLGDDLLELLTGQVDLVQAPVIMSGRQERSVDVVIIIGAVRNDRDIEEVKKSRANSKVLVSFGACACFGGIPSLGNLSSRSELLETAYIDAPTIGEEEKVPQESVPTLTEKVRAVHEITDVDYRLPGCPPPPAFIKGFLLSLLDEVSE